MNRPLAWARDGQDWPNHQASRFVRAGGIAWHVQVMGSGPVALLAHGTGAATHSWRDLAPLLAAHFTVVAPDLPGHGFTEMPPRRGLSLPGMAAGLHALTRELGVEPAIAVGHSAGAAVLARMALDGTIAPRALVSLNGALLPLFGLTGQMFSGLAKLAVGVPGVASLFARQAGEPRNVERLLNGTGSRIDARGAELYRRVAGNPVHAGAALAMMANWDLQPLARDLRRLPCRLVLVVGANDRTVPPGDSARVRNMVPGATLVSMPALGHLSHEEQPARTAELILRVAQEQGVLPS